MPGYIPPTGGSLTVSNVISDATLANGVLDGNGTFTGIRNQNLGPVTIGSTAPGFIMQLGADNGNTVTLSGTNTYTGGTTILAGTLIISSDANLGAAAPTSYTIDPNNVDGERPGAANGITFNSLSEGAGTLQIGTSLTTNRPIAVNGEIAAINTNGGGTTVHVDRPGSPRPGAAAGLGFGQRRERHHQEAGAGTLISGAGEREAIRSSTATGSFSNGTLIAASDAALGNTTGPSFTIGQIMLDNTGSNSGIFKAGASFSSVRSVSVTGTGAGSGAGSIFDTNGFTTSFSGSLTNAEHKLTVTNTSSSSLGTVTFGSLNISGSNTTSTTGATAILALTDSGQGVTVNLTNGVTRTDRSTLLIAPTTAATDSKLGITQKVALVSGTAPTVSERHGGALDLDRSRQLVRQQRRERRQQSLQLRDLRRDQGLHFGDLYQGRIERHHDDGGDRDRRAAERNGQPGRRCPGLCAQARLRVGDQHRRQHDHARQRAARPARPDPQRLERRHQRRHAAVQWQRSDHRGPWNDGRFGKSGRHQRPDLDRQRNLVADGDIRGILSGPVNIDSAAL